MRWITICYILNSLFWRYPEFGRYTEIWSDDCINSWMWFSTISLQLHYIAMKIIMHKQIDSVHVALKIFIWFHLVLTIWLTILKRLQKQIQSDWLTLPSFCFIVRNFMDRLRNRTLIGGFESKIWDQWKIHWPYSNGCNLFIEWDLNITSTKS